MSKNIIYCVKNVMVELEEADTNKYQKYLQLAYRGFRDLNLFVTPNIKTVYLDMNDALAAKLPPDYVKYRAIGLVVNGRIYNLTLDERLALNRKVDECDNPITDLTQLNNDKLPADTCGYRYYPHFRNGLYVGEAFGYGGGHNPKGYFRMDMDKGQIQFNSVIPKTELIMEYKSNGLEEDGSAVIPEECVEALIQWIFWKRIEHDKRVGLAEKAVEEQKYKMWYGKAKKYINQFTAAEFRDMLWSSNMMVAKR